MAKIVIHRDGTQEIFQTEKIIQAIQQVIEPLKLSDPFIPMFKIIKNFELKLPDQISTDEIDRLLLKAIEGLISDDAIYDDIATAQLVKIINKSVNTYFKSFREYIEFAVQEKLLSTELLAFDLDTLELSINYDFDKEFNYFGLDTLQDRYLVKNRQKAIIEKPQWMWMRVAMGLALLETDKESYTLKLYKKFAQLKYIHSTPTLYNAGTPHSQLSSCYINVLEDSMESIMEKATETAYFAKFAGGVGTSITKLRASGSHIKSLNAKSSGPIPFIKIFDTVINSIMQGGRRRSSQVIYMEPRHYNFEEFLDLKETNGNDYVRTRSLNTACWIPDEFMQRVIHDDYRYLVDPAECPELTTTWGKEFSAIYQAICQRAEEWKIKLFKKVRAQDLYRDILMRAAKTGNYWLNFKDRHNEKNQAPSYSLIHSSNLCTEISIPNNEGSTAVCTLASVNLARIVDTKLMHQVDLAHMSVEQKANLINWDELKDTIHTAIRALDNVLDINYYPSAASKKNSLDLRPLGLGIMGLGELLIQLHIPYEHKDALTLSEQIAAFMHAEALAASEKLAVERGAFADWSAERYSYGPRRNALLLAIAPTASISNIAGTSSGIETFFANVYSRETLSWKYTIIVKQLVEQLKEAGMRNEEIKNKIIANGGSVQHIAELDGHLDKQIFKTVYETTPFSQVDIAAVWQKYIDQSISRNMYIKEELRDNLFDIYVYARQQGLKSTYYCFIEKTIQGEKYNQKINKRGERAGFGKSLAGGAFTATAQTSSETTPHQGLRGLDPKQLTAEQKQDIEREMRLHKGDAYVDQLKAGTLYDGACPIDPFEKVMCTSCQ
jgi:ribonucleoside-diphosphate reductase alpha chain